MERIPTRRLITSVIAGVVVAGTGTGIGVAMSDPASSVRTPTSQGVTGTPAGTVSAPIPDAYRQRPKFQAPYPIVFGDSKPPVKIPLHTPPKAGLLFDLDTGAVLWTQAPWERLPVASLTKIMTAYVAVRRTHDDEQVKVPGAVKSIEGDASAMGNLYAGKAVPLKGLLAGLLIVSASDAAMAIAHHVSGSPGAFVRTMNRQARLFGHRCTRYVDPYGISQEDRSCAADLAELTRSVMNEPRITELVRKRLAQPKFPHVKGGHLWLVNTNPLLRSNYHGATGVKTGYTNPAGQCLVATAERRGTRLGVVLLNSYDTGAQAAKILNAGFRFLGGTAA